MVGISSSGWRGVEVEVKVMVIVVIIKRQACSTFSTPQPLSLARLAIAVSLFWLFYDELNKKIIFNLTLGHKMTPILTFLTVLEVTFVNALSQRGIETSTGWLIALSKLYGTAIAKVGFCVLGPPALSVKGWCCGSTTLECLLAYYV